ncbi:MAG: UbiA family prenyltransferase [Alphaproteobacteria bacterium]|nr:UbiA family prenyltransferase [Alphaproteobacteria bacterium]
MRPPLCVDLDGTLIRKDLLYESLLAALRRRPWILFAIPFWLLAGRAVLKRRLAEAAGDALVVETLPLTDDLVIWLTGEKTAGRRIELISASDDTLVRRVADWLDLFDMAEGSDGTTNLKGAAKAARLAERHPDGFVYAGDSRADLAVWARAAGAIPVNAARGFEAEVARHAPVEAAFGAQGAHTAALLRALRPHQWAKNALLFLPLLLTRAYADLDVLASAVAAFVLISLAASGTYLMNDLLDLAVDRSHPSKRNRPFAAGRLSLPLGLILAPVLVAVGVIGAAWIDTGLLLCLLAYLALTIGYSFGIKTRPVIDVLTLGGLFTLRLLAGHTLIDGGIPVWLLVFSMFFFTSLALVKRLTEVRGLQARGIEAIPGRGYTAGDAGIILGLGLTTGVASVLVFMIYLVTEPLHVARLNNPEWLWVVPLVLGYWLPRVWLLADRGVVHDDPVLFALKDRTSLFLGALALTAVILAA